MGLMCSKCSDKVDPGPVDLEDEDESKTPFPKNRRCTDVYCLLPLLIFLVVWLGLLLYCIKYGDIARITMGYDRCGNVCGRVNERFGVAPDEPNYNCYGADMREKRFLSMTNAGLQEQLDNANVRRECVASCDNYTDFKYLNRCILQTVTTTDNHTDYVRSSNISVGHSEGGGWVQPVAAASEEQKWRNMSTQVLKQPATLVNTNNKGFPDNRFRRHVTEAVNRRHLLQYQDPEDYSDDRFSETGYDNFFQEVAEDLDFCWKELLALFFIALGFTTVLMLIMILVVKVVVIMSLVVGFIVSLFATVYLWVKWGYEQDRLSPQSMTKIENRVVNTYLGCAIAATIIFVFLFPVLFVMRKRVGQVIHFFEKSGRAISDMPTLLILPWLSFTIVGGLIATWLYLALWIESSGKLVSENNVNFFYENDKVAHIARWWNLVALLWLIQFFMACQHLVVAGAVGDWYFSKDKVTLKQPVDRSMERTIRYHLGTAAIGSTLVASLHFTCFVFKKVEGCLPTSNIPFYTSLSTCIKYPFVKCIEFVNRNAYIKVALTGCNFYEGGRRLMRPKDKIASDVADIDSAGDFLLFMTKIGVMLSTMLVAIAFMHDKEGVMHVWVLSALAASVGYAEAHIFISVYEVAIDTIFICLCEDYKINDGVERPYFMSIEKLT